LLLLFINQNTALLSNFTMLSAIAPLHAALANSLARQLCPLTLPKAMTLPKALSKTLTLPEALTQCNFEPCVQIDSAL
jgi:hypothetical protein